MNLFLAKTGAANRGPSIFPGKAGRRILSGKWYFSWKDLRSMLIFGWNDSAMFCVLPLLFPYCIENDDLPILDEEITLDDEHVMAFVGRVDDFLKQNAVPKKTAMLVELACEEYLLFTKERNKDKRVEAECCIGIEPDKVFFSIWDSGEVFDLTDENAVPDSIRAYVVASLMERQTGKKHMIATSFNRNSFSFPISDGNGSSASSPA